jgi:ABC-type Fe3+-siderophore transport system permease subunit
MMPKKQAERATASRVTRILVILVIGILLLSVLSVNAGKMELSFAQVLDVLLGKGSARENLIVYEFRLPRMVLSILVGVGMGASGNIMQTLLRNDMASPGTLGINSGAGLFVLLYVVAFSAKASPLLMPFLAFAGGITAALLIFLLSYRRGRSISPTGLILTGVALSSGYSALSMLLTLRLDRLEMDFVMRWNGGSLWGDNWNYIAALLPWVLLFFAYAFYKSRILNTLNLGLVTATGLGVAIKSEFIGLSFVSVALSSACVAMGGNFFFVGMISPHMARRLVGGNHAYLMPASALLGAIIVLAADTLTRALTLGTSVPTGIVITVLSTPYFLYLLAKSN